MEINEQEWAGYRQEANKCEGNDKGETWAFVGNAGDVSYAYVEGLKVSAMAHGARVYIEGEDVFVVFAPLRAGAGGKAALLRQALEEKVEECENILLANMPSKGDREDDCQRLCVLNQVNGLLYAVNGIAAEDLVEDPDHDPQYRS